ncbi:DUF4352 domain-containing protein [Bacillus mobilis]|uniref:DUF4352 domain-containing protein n=1 Tax=Bacillus mobilis TaxID=2026190 RepID=UPI002E238D8F|nr:DUF4352 domain-containing protein [Bacillus mobilis]MED0994788.1 DUF4352 domain-containing protein [Bacillus mobilis]MED1002538.1 DUF4352 domain-containing protein [Bacillus mobilis]
MKTSFYTKWWFWVNIAIVLILVSNNYSNKKVEAKKVSIEPKQDIKKESSMKEETKKEISREGESSNVKIVVNGYLSSNTIFNEYLNEPAQGVFRIIEVSITNNQKKAITIDANNFKLVDDQGREFAHSTQGQAAYDAVYGDKSDFFLKQLNPGLTLTGPILFDVPVEAKGLVLKVNGSMIDKEISLKVN